MAIDEKIENIRDILKKTATHPEVNPSVIESILDILRDVSDELDEINECMFC